MDQEKIKHAVSELLEAFGEDPQREGLKETPQRVAKMYAEIFASLNHQPEDFSNYKTFHVDDQPEMVLIQQIPFYSMCEHHLLPFFGNVSVAYVPRDGKVIGLSKIPRLVDFVAKKPGMQERLTTELANELQRILNPKELQSRSQLGICAWRCGGSTRLVSLPILLNLPVSLKMTWHCAKSF